MHSRSTSLFASRDFYCNIMQLVDKAIVKLPCRGKQHEFFLPCYVAFRYRSPWTYITTQIVAAAVDEAHRKTDTFGAGTRRSLGG